MLVTRIICCRVADIMGFPKMYSLLPNDLYLTFYRHIISGGIKGKVPFRVVLMLLFNTAGNLYFLEAQRISIYLDPTLNINLDEFTTS